MRTQYTPSEVAVARSLPRIEVIQTCERLGVVIYQGRIVLDDFDKARAREAAEEVASMFRRERDEYCEALQLIAMADLEQTGPTVGVKGATMTTALEMRSIARKACERVRTQWKH